MSASRNRIIVALLGCVITLSFGAQPGGATVASAEMCANYIADNSLEYHDWFNANGDAEVDVADVVTLMNQVIGLHITDLSWVYSEPYLIDFNFTLRDDEDVSIVLPPEYFQIQALENGIPISPTETGFQLQGALSKQLKCALVLDYTLSMVSSFGAIDTMEAAAKAFIDAMNQDGQIGIYEFHNEEDDPIQVAPFSLDRDYLKTQIDRIQNEIAVLPGGTHVWDAVYMAVEAFGIANLRDEQRFIIFLSDGRDESSFRSPSEIIALAQERGVRIYAIGFGDELTPEGMIEITEATNGAYLAASTVEEMAEQFNRIIRDLGGQYTLRWATLKRSSTPFTPSFNITLNSVTASGEASEEYVPPDWAGNTLQGVLRFIGGELSNTSPRTAVFLRAEYVPRGIRHIRLRLYSQYPFQVRAVTEELGGLVSDWSITRTHLGSGEYQVDMVSPDPGNFSSSIPYGSFGPMLRFEFINVHSLTDVFSEVGDVWADNTIYETTGHQSFRIGNCEMIFDRNGWASGVMGAEEVLVQDADTDGIHDVLCSASNAGTNYIWHSWDLVPYARRSTGGGIGMNSVDTWHGFIVASSGIQQSFFCYRPKASETQVTWELEVQVNGMPGATGACAVDLDEDGDVDMVGCVADTGEVVWLENGADGWFKRTIDFGFAGAADTQVIDLDGDGDTDVVGAAEDLNRVTWWEFDLLTETFDEHIITNSLTGASDLYLADIDSDGDIDIAATGKTGGRVAWLENDGEEHFSTHLIDVGASGAEGIFAGDLDGDGDVDLTACSRDLDIVWAWLNDGFQSFQRIPVVEEFNGPSHTTAADWDGDGDLDIFISGFFANEVIWFENRLEFVW